MSHSEFLKVLNTYAKINSDFDKYLKLYKEKKLTEYQVLCFRTYLTILSNNISVFLEALNAD